MLGRLDALQNALHRIRLERPWPEPLQLRGRAWQNDDDGIARAKDQSRRRAGQPERDGALWQRRLLADARLEVRVRALQPYGHRARDLADPRLQLVVDVQRQPGRARDELHGAVVVRRAESARDDAEIRLERHVERGLQL